MHFRMILKNGTTGVRVLARIMSKNLDVPQQSATVDSPNSCTLFRRLLTAHSLN